MVLVVIVTATTFTTTNIYLSSLVYVTKNVDARFLAALEIGSNQACQRSSCKERNGTLT